jgi:hypothetical protein
VYVYYNTRTGEKRQIENAPSVYSYYRIESEVVNECDTI